MSRFTALFILISLATGCGLFQDTSNRVHSDELILNVNQIRDFEQALKELFDSYSACGSRDEAIKSAKEGKREWVTTPCWVNIGWEPDGKVAGGFWVEVKGDDMLVGGLIIHQNGTIIEVHGSAKERAKVVTPTP